MKKTLRFFTVSFYQANYTANHVIYFLNQKNKIPRKLWKCIVGCIFNSVGLIVTPEIPCILQTLFFADLIDTNTLTIYNKRIYTLQNVSFSQQKKVATMFLF
jgi:hypothetical protein